MSKHQIKRAIYNKKSRAYYGCEYLRINDFSAVFRAPICRNANNKKPTNLVSMFVNKKKRKNSLACGFCIAQDLNTSSAL